MTDGAGVSIGGRTVLVVTRLDDPTADVVIEELHARRVPVVRLDPGDFPASVTLNASFGQEGLGGELRTASRVVDLSGVRSVYWRRPSPYRSATDSPQQVAHWAVEQARFGLDGVLAALPGAHFVNHPWRNRAAEYKPAQLAVAAQCGLAVPATLVTNDLAEARRFAREHGPVVYKPLRGSDFAGRDGRAHTVWDFGLGRDGRWWMYECNPNGQWAWFPEAISARIAAAIADQLQTPGDPHDR